MRILAGVLVLATLALSGSSCGCLIGCGCPGYEKDLVKLDSRARAWLPAPPAATAVFANSRGQRQTVALVSYTDAIEHFDQGDECPEGKREYVRARWAGPALPDTLTVHLYNQLVNPGVEWRFSAIFDAAESKTGTNGSYAGTQQLGGRTFSQVIGGRCITACHSQNVTEVYVAKGLGLVAFQLQNELWVRQ